MEILVVCWGKNIMPGKKYFCLCLCLEVKIFIVFSVSEPQHWHHCDNNVQIQRCCFSSQFYTSSLLLYVICANKAFPFSACSNLIFFSSPRPHLVNTYLKRGGQAPQKEQASKRLHMSDQAANICWQFLRNISQPLFKWKAHCSC